MHQFVYSHVFVGKHQDICTHSPQVTQHKQFPDRV